MDIPASPSCNSAASPGWDDVRYAVVIARCGSVAGAARQLGVDQTTVARRLRALEACLGTPLFERLRRQGFRTACAGITLPNPASVALHERLAELDPATAERLKPNDSQRIERALEICLLAGRPMSELLAEPGAAPLPYALTKLALVPSDRAVLHARIAERFDQMLDQVQRQEFRFRMHMVGLRENDRVVVYNR